MLPVESPFKTYTGLDGRPLMDGYVWFGAVDQNPITNRVKVYWDAEGTIPAAQPLRTINGYISRAGTPANVFIDGTYSELVQNHNKVTVFYAPDSSDFSPFSAGQASLIKFTQAGTGAVQRTVQDKLRETVNVLDFGATAAGVIADTKAIQAGIDYLNGKGGGILFFPAGTYLLDATLKLYNNVRLSGQGGTSTVLLRKSAYGDTIKQTNGFCAIDGFFMQHGTNSKAGDISLDYLLTDSSAHIRLVNTQNAEITGNIIWRMPYGIVNDGGINSKIHQNWIQGVWDPMYSAMQEGLADLAFIGTTQHGQLAKVTSNYFSGAVNSARTFTYTDGTNTVTANYPANIGSKNNVLAQSIEGLDLVSNYFGRAAMQLIRFAPTAIIADVRVISNFFDNASNGSDGISSQITTETNVSGMYVLGMTVNGNVFNGEYDTMRAFEATPNPTSSAPSVLNLTYSDNSHFAHVATPVVLTGVSIASVNGNTIQGYNSLNVAKDANGRLTFTSPVFVGAKSSHVSVSENIIGGGGAGGDEQNYCYSQVTIDPAATNCNAHDNTYAGIKRGTNFARGIARSESQTQHTAAGNYQATSNDTIYIRNKTTSEASLISLPTYPVIGQEIIVKDGKGDAGAFNLAVSTSDGTIIDGAATQNLNINYITRRFRFNGSQWNVIG